MKTQRPILISVIQYISELESGTLSVPDLVARLPDLHVDGIELRRESWANYAKELPAVREVACKSARLSFHRISSKQRILSIFSPSGIIARVVAQSERDLASWKFA